MEEEMATLREKLQAKAALAALQLLEITLPPPMPVVVAAQTLATQLLRTAALAVLAEAATEVCQSLHL